MASCNLEKEPGEGPIFKKDSSPGPPSKNFRLLGSGGYMGVFLIYRTP